MNSRKNVLTTGEVAKICNVAARTVSKWFDSGELRGYRIPGSKDRRIPLNQLVRFMRAHGIPLGSLETGQQRVLVVDADVEFAEALKRALRQSGPFEVSVAACSFEAGALAMDLRPYGIVIDVDSADVSPKRTSRFVRSQAELRGTRLVGMAKGLTKAKGQALLQDGFDAYLSKPFEVHELIEQLERKHRVETPGDKLIASTVAS